MAGPALAPGTLLSGRYQLLEAIGQSDLSQVYAASDQRGQAQVALKIFDREVLGRSMALSDYQAQARHASGLGVEGIARAYDFGIDANSGLPFSTAERIGWTSLDRRVLAQGPVSVLDWARALSVLGRALDAAHTAGLPHRDLKPQNVFVSPDNPEWVRITDFGMTAVRRGAAEAMGWGGPPGYTPPEAVDAASPPSPAADLFALGLITYFAFTRTTPFRSLRAGAFDPNQHWAELNQPLAPLSERAREVGVPLDPLLDPWFSRALAVDPQARFRSAGEMAREFAALTERLVLRGPRGTVGIPGIAAAIAQPLVFQPEPSPASFGLKPAPLPVPGAEAAPGSVVSASLAEAPVSVPEPAGVPRKGAALPLLIGLGIVLLSAVAFGGYLLLDSDPAPAPTAAPSAPPSAIPALTAVPTASAVSESAAPPPASEPAPSAVATSAPPAVPTAAKPVAPATPVPKPAAVAPKPVAAQPTSKPSQPKEPKPTTAKPASEPKPTSTKPKKKCSTFLGCK